MRGMEPEQSARSFSDDELSLLAWRQREQQISGTGQSVALQLA